MRSHLDMCFRSDGKTAGWLSQLQDHLGMGGAGFRCFAPILTHDPLLQIGFRRFHAVLTDNSVELLQKEGAAVSFFSELHERLGLDVAASVSDRKLQRAAEFIADNNSSSVKPMVAPLTWRMAGRKPNCAPALSATMLTGPGDMEEASAKAAMDSKRLIESS